MSALKPLFQSVVCAVVLGLLPVAAQAAEMNDRDAELLQAAQACRAEVVASFNRILKQGKLKEADLRDTFYIPIPGTSPQKFSTRYDKVVAKALQPVLENCLQTNDRLVFAIIVDVNGYAPLHNRLFSQPPTGDRELDAKRNRTKRIFSDRTGLAAARNTAPYLLQQYNRDTGESMADLSVPIIYRGAHWGAVRLGYKN